MRGTAYLVGLVAGDREAVSRAQHALEQDGYTVICARSDRWAGVADVAHAADLAGSEIDAALSADVVVTLPGAEFCTEAVMAREFGVPVVGAPCDVRDVETTVRMYLPAA